VRQDGIPWIPACAGMTIRVASWLFEGISMFDELRMLIAHHLRSLQSFTVCGNIIKDLLMWGTMKKVLI